MQRPYGYGGGEMPGGGWQGGPRPGQQMLIGPGGGGGGGGGGGMGRPPPGQQRPAQQSPGGGGGGGGRQYVVALYDYQARSKLEHSMTKGEKLVLRNPDTGDGWAEVEKEGCVGCVPASYIENRPGQQRGKSDDKQKVAKDNELQTRPTKKWTKVRELGRAENTGGLNGGVFIVKDYKGVEHVEKRAAKKMVEDGAVLQELIILKYLSEPSHLHITKMVDHYLDKKQKTSSLYLELCDLGGLDTLIHARADGTELFNEIDVWEWFIQLFSGLTYCHYGPDPKARFQNRDAKDYQGGWDMVFHRDLKVENILVSKGTPKGQTTGYTLKIADFGCAVARRHIWTDAKGQQLKTPFKTPGWTPPEWPNFVGRSDVWQMAAVIGCICNLMIMPYYEFSDPAPGYTQILGNAIVTCMEKDHKKRPKSDAVLDHVKGKYKKLSDNLNKTASPVPSNIDKAKRMNQLKRGEAELKEKIRREKEGHQKGQPASAPPGGNQGGRPWAGNPGRLPQPGQGGMHGRNPSNDSSNYVGSPFGGSPYMSPYGYGGYGNSRYGYGGYAGSLYGKYGGYGASPFGEYGRYR